MKHSNHHIKVHSPGPKLVPVHFEFTHPTAVSVCVAGTFNHWQPEAKPMHSLGGGRWHKESDLPLGTHEYCLVVDGHWMPDPRASETVSNPFGGRNSILKVVDAVEAAPAADGEPFPLENQNQSEPAVMARAR